MKRKIKILKLPENLEISDMLTADEMPKVNMKTIEVKTPKKDPAGPSFHEKSDKNKKVNVKIRHEELMRIKYGRPKTKGKKK